jgi:hypothetical protein
MANGDGGSVAQNPFHQSTLFWGCVSAVIAIVIAVVVAMIKDVRWLLFVAWPFATIAVLEFARTWSSPKRIRWITAVGGIASAVGLVGLYLWLAPESSRAPSAQSGPQAAALSGTPKGPEGPPSVLHRHYTPSDRERLSAVLYDLHTLLNETVMPAQLQVHQTLSEVPALVRSQGMQTAKARLSNLGTVFTDARDDYIRRFKSGSHYYADEIEDITSNKDELNAEIVALDKFIAVLSALPENAQPNLIELMKPYEASLRDANVSVGNWVVRCNERIKAKRDALQ